MVALWNFCARHIFCLALSGADIVFDVVLNDQWLAVGTVNT